MSSFLHFTSENIYKSAVEEYDILVKFVGVSVHPTLESLFVVQEEN